MQIAFENGKTLAIQNIQLAGNLNLSNIPHRIDKWAEMPTGTVVVDGYREKFTSTDHSATIIFEVPWSARKSFVDWAIGYTTTEVSPNQPATGRLLRKIPLQHPEFPWMYCTDVDLRGGKAGFTRSETSYAVNGSGQILFPDPENIDSKVLLPMTHYIDNRGNAHYDGKATYAATFRPLDYEVRTEAELSALRLNELGRYVSREITYNVIALPLAKINSFLKFVPGTPYGSPPLENATPVPESGIKLIPGAQLVYTWHEVPDIPREALRDCLGKVNAEPFDGVRTGYEEWPAETLLCQPPKIKRSNNVVGRVTWDIEYRFDYRPDGWNSWFAADGNFYRATLTTNQKGDANGELVYKTADFTQLFRAVVPKEYH